MTRETAQGVAFEWLLAKWSCPDAVWWAWFQSLTPEAVAEVRNGPVAAYRLWPNLLESAGQQLAVVCGHLREAPLHATA